MTRVEVKSFLLKEFVTEYASTTPVAYANNQAFTEPVNSPWVRFEIRFDDSEQVTVGVTPRRKFERTGMIWYQVFIPPNTGTYEGGVLCEQINDIFEGKRFNTIICKNGEWREIGNTDDDWFQFNGVIYFEFDQIK